MEVICMEYKQIKDNEQWNKAIKSHADVRFTDEFRDMVVGTFDHMELDQVLSTTAVHRLMCKMVAELQHHSTDELTNKELAILQTLMWEDRKYGITEEVKA
jgi:hypothetical protein